MDVNPSSNSGTATMESVVKEQVAPVMEKITEAVMPIIKDFSEGKTTAKKLNEKYITDSYTAEIKNLDENTKTFMDDIVMAVYFSVQEAAKDTPANAAVVIHNSEKMMGWISSIALSDVKDLVANLKTNHPKILNELLAIEE